MPSWSNTPQGYGLVALLLHWGMALLLLVLAAIAAMASAVAVSTIGKAYLTVVSEWWDNLVFQLGQLF